MNFETYAVNGRLSVSGLYLDIASQTDLSKQVDVRS